MASTSIGYQIAIPHGISHTVNRDFIGFVQIKDAFHWNHDEKQSVQLIFLIGVPQDNQNNIHLKFISLLSRRLLDDNFRKQLIEVEDVEDAYRALNAINGRITPKCVSNNFKFLIVANKGLVTAATGTARHASIIP